MERELWTGLKNLARTSIRMYRAIRFPPGIGMQLGRSNGQFSNNLFELEAHRVRLTGAIKLALVTHLDVGQP